MHMEKIMINSMKTIALQLLLTSILYFFIILYRLFIYSNKSQQLYFVFKMQSI